MCGATAAGCAANADMDLLQVASSCASQQPTTQWQDTCKHGTRAVLGVQELAFHHPHVEALPHRHAAVCVRMGRCNRFMCCTCAWSHAAGLYPLSQLHKLRHTSCCCWCRCPCAAAVVIAAVASVQDPNPEDPLNKEAAQKFQESQRNFETIVQRSIHYGAQIANDYFPPCAS